MARLNIERQIELEPNRIDFAKREIEKFGYVVTVFSKQLNFTFKNEIITLYPYSGWFTGKTVMMVVV